MKTEGDHSIHPSVVTQEIPNDWREIDIKIPGLTKREYFAAMAMQGMLQMGAQTENGGLTRHPNDLAKLAINQADALIEALNQKTK